MYKIKLPLLLLIFLVGIQFVKGQNKPFPQALNFPNCIKPSNVTQAAMNTSVTSYYTYWKGKYLKNNLASLPGGYYVLGDITGDADGYNPLGSSEGQGYGMLITVMMAGYDANAKTIYDGLFKTARAYKSSQNPNLMGWVVADAASAQGHFDSATDGDMDIAYSLILAHYQWGSNGTINYLNEAKNMITNGLKASYVTNGNRLNLGDWDSKTSTSTRPSDWMLSHLKAFKDVTGDVVWDNVSTTTYGLISSLQTNYSSTTGLMPDFATGNPVKPAAPNFLESANDGDYYYNACRTPLRFVMDFAHYGNTSGKTVVNKIVTWAKTKTGGTPTNFRAGYTLAGNDVNGNNYASAVFVAPIVAASTCDAAHQAFLNSGWSSIINMKEGYFEDTYNMLCMLYISGNWWIPQASGNQMPTVNITSPANNTTFTAPASVTMNATAADADGTISKVEFYNGTTLLGTSTTSAYSYTWTNVAAGTYSITAKAYDNAGGTTTSSAISISVTSTPVNQYTISKTNVPLTIDGVLDETAWVNAPYTENYLNMDGTAATQVTKAKMLWSDSYLYLSFVVQDNSIWSTLTARDAQLWTQDVLEVLIDKDGDGVNYNEIGFAPNGALYDLLMDKPYSAGGTGTTSWDITGLNVKTTFTGTLNTATGGTQWVVEVALPFAGIPATPATFGKPNVGDSWRLNLARADHNYNDANSQKLYTWNYTDGVSNHVPSKFGKVIFGDAPANNAPTVSITSPINNATFTVPATITINANAADTDGSISKVEFYNGTTLLGSDNTSPYSYNWTNVAAGTYSVTAKATDNLGSVTASSVVTVIVTVPESPYGGTRTSIPGTVQAENYDLGGQNVAYNDATAANEGGAYRTDAVDIEAITGGGYNVGYIQAGEWLKYMVNVTTTGKYKIEAYVAATAAGSSFTLDMDGTIIATVNVPNTGGWQTWQVVTIDNVSLTAGDKILKFNATNANFNFDKVVFTLIPNVAPTVSITAPINNATFTAPASVTINATANDADGSISKVEFYNGTTLLNSDNATPFSYNWAGVTAGTYTITAKAYDNLNLSTTSSAITIVVNNPNVAPTVSITAPTNNATFTAPASVTINATANDADGSVSKVEFYNGTTLLNSDNATPFSYNWSGVTAGIYTITVKAYDNLNLSTTSSAITIVVNNPNVAPTVSITAPTNNATFTAPASVTINATANDADGSISKVEFYNGTTLLNSDNATPFSYNWTGVTAGTYTITAKAYDNLNLSTTSSAITIVVNNPNVAPTVSITSPTNNAMFTAPASVTINATANDTDGSISKVDFYNGTTLLNSDNVTPFSYNWTGVTAGTYTITAKAYDNLNLSASSTPITIVVNNPNVAPTVSITAPTNNTTFTSPASVTINATANDTDGSISKVEFYNGTTLLNSDATQPYSYDWSGVAAGTYSITAKAYDNTGASTSSEVISIVVNNPNSTPEVTITSTATSSVAEGTTVTVTATATDPDGVVTKIELLDGDIKIGELSSGPFVFTLTNLSIGSHSITVVATDNSGGKTTSAPINFTVTQVTALFEAMSSEIQLMNYPNPFNTSTEIQLNLIKSGETRVIIYDQLGHEVAVLENGFLTQGIHKYNLDGSIISPGMYVCKVVCQNQYKSLIIMKQ